MNDVELQVVQEELMVPEPPPKLEWLDPWQRLEGSGDSFVAELHRELPSRHVLYGLGVVAVAKRSDCDDVLFVTDDPISPLAVVHLTWADCMESDPGCPSTTLYKDWRDWIERCLLPDHEDYGSEG